jgi:hypothetical protein
MIDEDNLLKSGVDEAEELAQLAKEARVYLLYHNWCKSVRRVSFALGFSKAAVFYAEIEPNKGESPTIWIVVGDLPPLHMDTEYCATARDALLGYIELMEDLCTGIRMGEDVSELPPIRQRHTLKILEPTLALIEVLEKRLAFLRKNFIDPDRDNNPDKPAD